MNIHMYTNRHNKTHNPAALICAQGNETQGIHNIRTHIPDRSMGKSSNSMDK